MEDLGFVPEKPAEQPATETVKTAQPTKITVKIPLSAADIRYNFYTLTDALIIAPGKERKFAKKIISVIKNTTKIARRRDLEAKKRAMPTDIYDVDDFRLEIENVQDLKGQHNYKQPRIVTVIDRKSGKIIDRITKPFLVARVTMALFDCEDKLEKSEETLASAKEEFQKIIDKKTQNQK